MPWKLEKNPYFIWLSEIILQQTKVEQGLKYYIKFTSEYPTVHDLAQAPLDNVLLNWEGLGYYSRARNLHKSAKFISEELNGEFPQSYVEILQLKGVGPYTAAAIASFAYNAPHAVLDGNVIRVLSRFFGIEHPYDTTIGKRNFQSLASSLLPKNKAGEYNQAIMDFGATICKPKLMQCHSCPLQESCFAFEKNRQSMLPIKSKKIKVRNRYFHFLVLSEGNHTFIEQRTSKDIWQQLFQFPLVETATGETLSHKAIYTHLKEDALSIDKEVIELKQKLSHQTIYAKFYRVSGAGNWNKYRKVEMLNLTNFAFPKIINLFLEENSVILNKRGK